MQIFHLGLHKTGTTSLQKNLFSKSQFLYHGPTSCLWKSNKHIRKEWYDFFMGQGAAPVTRNEHFIYSSEGTLLRCGGLSGAENVARQIAKNFSDPKVLITVREPSALLISAYFQSLPMRKYALGFLTHQEPAFHQSVRFMPFEEWWERLTDTSDISLAGLLEYNKLRASLETWLKPDQIVFLKLEALIERNPGYTNKLRQLGFDGEALEDFLLLPPENAGSSKELTRENPRIAKLGNRLAKSGLANTLGTILRTTGLMRTAEKIIYSGKGGARSRINNQVLDEIRIKFRQGYESIE